MGPYGIVRCSVWDKAEFRALTSVGKLVLLFIWTNQKRNSAGIYRESIESLQCISPFDGPEFCFGFAEAIEAGFMFYDKVHKVLLLKNHAKHCPPANPNIVRSWTRIIVTVPSASELWWRWHRQTYDHLKAEMQPAFLETFGAAWQAYKEPVEKPREPRPNPHAILFPAAEVAVAKPPKPARKRGAKMTDEEFIAALKANPAYSHISIDTELGKMDAWLMTKPGRQKTHSFVINWLNKIQKPMPTGQRGKGSLTAVGQRSASIASELLKRHENGEGDAAQ